jgi:hypothetical protein
MKNILEQVAEPIIDVKNKMGANENPGTLRIGHASLKYITLFT